MTRNCFFLFFSIFSISLFGATFTVTNLNDSGPGSIRQAFIESNNNGTLEHDIINVEVSGEIVLTSVEFVDVNILPSLDNVTLNGNGIKLKSILNGRFFQINNTNLLDVFLNGGKAALTGGTLLIQGTSTLTRVHMQNGLAGTLGPNSQGGAARCFGGSNVTMIDCTLRNNEAQNGAAISINTGATLTMLNCIISDNTVTTPGLTDCAVYLQGTLNATDCIFANTLPAGTPDIHDLGMTFATNVNNLVEIYELAPGGTPPSTPFASTADPQLVPESSDPYFYYVFAPTSPLKNVGPRFAPGGAVILSNAIPTLGQWGLIILGLLMMIMSVVFLARREPMEGTVQF